LRPHLVALVGLVAVLTACDATCQQTCRQLIVECDGVEHSGTTRDECEVQCEQQKTLYEDTWEDEDLSLRFADYRNCVVDSTCADVEDGVCYDEELFAY
jgi:hypothetical protein